MITTNTKMADLLHYNIHLLSIFKRLGIRLGFEERTIKDICVQYNIDMPFFLEIIRFFLTKEHYSVSNLSTFKAGTIIKYLQKTHDYYLNHTFPLISSQIDKLMATNYDRKDLALVKKFFISYHNEFTKHIEREEMDIFPYVMEIEKGIDAGFADNILLARIKKYPIKRYAKEHENVDEKVNDLYNILIKYLSPLPNEEIVYSILYELFDLERDVKDHSVIEDKILIPKVSELENILLEKKKKAF